MQLARYATRLITIFHIDTSKNGKITLDLLGSLMLFIQQYVSNQKKPKWTALIIIDSQATKSTCKGKAAEESEGFCNYKTTKGIKRHLAVNRLKFHFSHLTFNTF